MLLKIEEQLTRHSYYETTVSRPAAAPALAARVCADVCVVGAGYAGLATALELAERGYSVALLEAQTAGWGASGRNGGQSLVGFGFSGLHAIEKQFSTADARRAWDISVAGLDLLQTWLGRYAIDCDYVPGQLSLAVNARKARRLHTWVEHVAKDYEYEMPWLSQSEIGDWIASEQFHSGAFDPHSGHLNPLKYCLALAAAARTAGVQIFEHSAVTRIERGSRPVVKTAGGEIACDFVVLAGNVYLDEYGGTLAPELKPRIMPVGTYIITTEPMGKARADALIRQRAAVFDTNLVLDYFRLTADHRLLFGGGESYSTFTPVNLARRMRKRMLTVFPQLSDLEVDFVWGGFVDITMNQAPDFGRLGNNIYYLQGFSGHGLALSGIAGQLVAETIAGQAERFDLFARLQHHAFPGGDALRTPALILGMLYYRLRDLF